MKHSIWIALPLAAALVAPVYAQQNTSNSSQTPPAATQSSDQPASQTNQAPPSSDQSNQSTQTTQTTSADQNQAHEPLQAERHEGFWGKINPMARKKYVQRQMEPIRNRVNELDELTAANGKAIKDVDARSQEGIRQATARANEADQHAIDAGNRAQAADQTAQQANTRLQTVQQVVTNIDQYQPATQTEIRLRPGQVVLSKKAKEALDQMAETVKGQNAYLFEVQGFSSGKGATAIENSQHVAQSVVRYLVLNHDIPVYRIYVLGMGNAPVPTSVESGKAHRATNGGRVEISLLKNPHLAELASAGPLQTPGAAPNTNTASQGGLSGTTMQPAQAPGTGSTTNSQQPASNLNAPASPEPRQQTVPQQQAPPPPR
jgi:hypothetical protein